jgi:peptide-methionine (R)-S-oxide reductase
MVDKVNRTPARWEVQLAPEAYGVTRRKAAEPAFTGACWDNECEGTDRCAGCGALLFASDSPVDAGCRGPGFSQPAVAATVRNEIDNRLFPCRSEALCAAGDAYRAALCGDGPAPTGLRYCINLGVRAVRAEERLT